MPIFKSFMPPWPRLRARAPRPSGCASAESSIFRRRRSTALTNCRIIRNWLRRNSSNAWNIRRKARFALSVRRRNSQCLQQACAMQHRCWARTAASCCAKLVLRKTKSPLWSTQRSSPNELPNTLPRRRETMEFELAEEHRMVKELVHRFVEDELIPLEAGVLAREAAGQGLTITKKEHDRIDEVSRSI